MQLQLLNGPVHCVGKIVFPATFQNGRKAFLSEHFACLGFRFYQAIGIQSKAVAGTECNRVLVITRKRKHAERQIGAFTVGCRYER